MVHGAPSSRSPSLTTGDTDEFQPVCAGALGELRIGIPDGEPQCQRLDRAELDGNVATAALYLAHVCDVLVAAAWQIDVLLDVLPVDPEQT